MSKIVAIVSVGIALSLESGTAQTAANVSITTAPSDTQTSWISTKYPAAKYMRIAQYNIHILGSPTVSDWFMRESYDVISNMVGAMKDPLVRAKFNGFQAVLITNADPDLGGLPGHRNSGGNGWSLFNEAIVRATAVDTIRPNDPAVYRGWETPIHEFGHAVEATLDLFDETKALHAANNYPTSGAGLGESYAWALQKWFLTALGDTRSSFPTWQYNYLAEVFDTNNTWSPTYGPRPTVTAGGPAGYTLCAGEGGSFSLPGSCDVAYGANGVFLYRSAQTGTISFNTTTFGSDPVPNVLKSGYYKSLTPSVTPVGPAGYTWCVGEGGSFTLPGACDVAYGANGIFAYSLNQTGTVTFNNIRFSPDPNPGVYKAGFYKLRSSSNTPVGPEGYTWCSREYGSFTLPGVCDLAYGANGAFTYRYGRSGTVTFNNANFGPDPAGGVVKSGFYKLTSSARILLAGGSNLVSSNSTASSKVAAVEPTLHSGLAKTSGSLCSCQGKVITFKKRPLAFGKVKLSYQIEVSYDLGKKDSWKKVETTEDATQITAVLPKTNLETFTRLRVAIK
jgi:hypothetical protein